MESRLELVVSSQAAEQHISRLQRELERLDGRGTAATAMMGKMSLAIGAISAAAGGLGFSRIIRETASFEDAMLGLQAVSGATASQMGELEKQARTLGATSMFSAEQAGNAQRYLAMAGLEVNEVLSATPGILKLATAGQLDLATAADIASNVLGGLNLEVSELSRVNDVLAATASGANTDIRQLGEALSYAAPFASKAGLSLEETAAAIGAMSDAGIQSSRAGTGLVGILAQLADATPKAQAAIEAADLSMGQLDIKARGLQPVLDDLRGANLGLGEALQIFGRDAGAAALNVINASEGVAEFTEELRNAEGAADEMSLIIGGGLTGSMKGFASMLSETIIGLGRDDGLAAGFQSVTDTATGMLAVYNGMLPAFAEANNLTEAQTDRIEALAAGVDMLGDAAIIAAGLYTGRFVSAMAAGAVSIANKTKASIADARATATATAAEIAFLKSVQGSLSAQLASSRSAVQRASLRKQLAANTAALTAANNTYTASLGRSTVAARAMGTATRGLNTALSLVGGPLGLLVGAGGLMYMFREELGLVDVAAQNATAALNENSNAIRGGTAAALDASYDNLVNSLEAVSLQAQEAMAQLTELTARQSFYENSHQGMADSVAGAIGEQEQALAGLWARQVELQAAIKANREERERSTSADNRSALVLKTLDEWLFKTTKSTDDLSSSTEKSADKTTTLADAYESLLDRITPNRREARQYARDLGVLNLALASGRMNTTQYMQAMGMLQESFQAAQRDTTDIAEVTDVAADEMARAWEEATNRIDETFSDAFAGAFDSFDSFADSLLDGFKRLLAELAYQATLKPIVVQFTQQMGGALGIPGVGGQGGGGGGFNLNGISSLYNGAKKLPYVGDAISGIGSALGFGASAAAPIGYASGFGAAAATGTYTGFAGSAAAGAAAAGGGGLMGAASAAMPWVGGALLVDNVLGLGIVDGIVGGISSLFGGGKTAPKFELATVGQDVDPTRHGLFENYGEGVYSRGALGTVGFYDPNTARLEETFDGFDNAKAFLDGITALDNAMVGAVANLDNGAEKTQAMANAAQAVRLNAGDAAGIANQLATRTLAVVDVIDGGFSASLRGLELSAEQITGRVVQAANAMQLLDSNSARLNLQFDASAAGAMRAADGMAQLMGGVGNLNASLSSFYDTFYTEEEKLQHLTEDLSGAFASMGRELPTTREGVRDVVESLELMGAAGQEQLATILQLNQPLAQYIAAMEAQNNVVNDSAAIAEERWRLENELLEAQGRDAELLARTRERELSSIDESNRALQERIWALQDETAAQQAANERADLLNRASLYSSGIVSGVDDALDAYNDQMQMASEIAREREQQLQEEMRAVQQLGGLLDSLLLSEQSILDPAARLQEAQRQFAELEVRAENGDTEAVAQLQGAAQAYLGEAAGYFGQASSQYASIFNDVTGSVESLEDSFGDSIAMLGSIEGIEQQMLREQQRARDSLNASLTQHVNQTNLLGSIADLLDMLPRGLASEIADILPEYSSGGGSGGSSGGSGGGFNSAAYLANKTAQVNRIGYEGRSNWTTSQVLDRIRAEWGSLEEHYNRVGKSEGVQPYATGAWQLARDQLAYVHEGEFIAPSREGIADEFRAYAAGDYQAELMAELGNIQRALPMANLPPMPMNMGSNQSASAPAINLEPLLRKIDALTQIVAQLRSERSSDAQKAANQRSEQVREQQKTNRNAKIRPTTKNGVGTV